jgi:outer membrane protein assembly factor BamB
VFSAPAVAGDYLYVGSCSGTLYCLERKTGAVKWAYDITPDGGQSFHGSMLIADEWILVGTDVGADGKGGHLYSLKLSTGEVRWKYPAGKGVSTDLLRWGSNLYAVAEIGHTETVLCLNLNTGKEIWKAGLPMPEGKRFVINKSPALVGDRLYFGAVDGKVYAFAAATGEKRVLKDAGSPIITPLAVNGELIYFGTESAKLYRLSSSRGEIVSQFDLNGRPYQPTVMGESGEFVVLFVNWTQPGGELLVLDSSLAKVRWRFAAANASPWTIARPYYSNKLLISGAQDGQVYGYDLRDGKTQWSHRVEGSARAFVSHDGVCYVGTVEGKVFALAQKQMLK